MLCASLQPDFGRRLDAAFMMNDLGVEGMSGLITQVLLVLGGAILGIAVGWLMHKRRRSSVYLMDLACYAPPSSLNISNSELVQLGYQSGVFTEESMMFQQKLIARSGLGNCTSMPPGITDALRRGRTPSLEEAKAESYTVLTSIVGDLLCKTGVAPAEVDIVIVSCSCFNPTPSLAAMVVNHFDMKESTLTYNLGGMGCSSSLVSVDLAKHLLQALPNKRALVISHENVTACMYLGNEKNMLITNCLFRMGGAAVLMSNRPEDASSAKYSLMHTVRTHLGRRHDAFSCMGDAQDSQGIRGIHLQRNVVDIAQKALKANLMALGPLVLPITELVAAVRKKDYIPDFRRAFDRFLIHTGGRGVIDAIQAGLSLTSEDCQPSFDTLHRFGNTSSASTWYILARLEHTGSIRRGDRIWQLGFGGGFKCNSAVWKARRDVSAPHPCWE